MTESTRAMEAACRSETVPTTTARRGYRPINDYAVVGDAQSAALIASDGGVDWLCLPHFDDPAVLCRILDEAKGGYLAVHPARPEAIRATLRRYRPGSNVLETTFDTETGSLRLTDAMPLAAGDPAPLDGAWKGRGRHRLIRLIDATQGPVAVELRAKLAFDFAATRAELTLVPSRGLVAADGAGRFLTLVWPGDLRAADDGELHGSLRLDAGERAVCVLAYAADPTKARALLTGEDWVDQVEETDAAWRAWSARCVVTGPYADAMLRSALTLKLLTFQPTGALVAAPTTSLPEAIGGVRNWDYRYCWLRDATFTLYAFLLLGDRSAAHAFWNWVARTCAGTDPAKLQIMFGIHGECDLPERTLDHLSGYRDSRPVRVGNGAADQRQLDVYGELLDAFWLHYWKAHEDGRPLDVSPEVWSLLRQTADYICEIWRLPDQGLWEARSGPRHYVFSKVMCWVGLDRALRLAEHEPVRFGRDDPEASRRWASERDALRKDILAHGYNSKVNAFTMAYDGDELDAAALRLPLVGFLPASDPRMRATIERIQEQLSVGGLLLRYSDRADDGLPPGEGTFSICTFWLIDCLTALGRIDEARELFERMLGYASDLGLFAEEVDPATGAALGNYPQAFTHLALIDAGVDLTEALARQAPVVGTAADRAVSVHRSRAERGSPGSRPPAR